MLTQYGQWRREGDWWGKNRNPQEKTFIDTLDFIQFYMGRMGIWGGLSTAYFFIPILHNLNPIFV